MNAMDRRTDISLMAKTALHTCSAVKIEQLVLLLGTVICIAHKHKLVCLGGSMG